MIWTPEYEAESEERRELYAPYLRYDSNTRKYY